MENTIDLKSLLQNGNLLPLAFLGDSVHTLYARQNVLSTSALKLGSYHSKASKYCKASSQAFAIKEIMPNLTEEEKDIVRRARNCKPKHQAKNATVADYSYATAFESLIGYLYLKNDEKRLQEILKLSCEIIDKKGEKYEN